MLSAIVSIRVSLHQYLVKLVDKVPIDGHPEFPTLEKLRDALRNGLVGLGNQNFMR